MKTAKDISQMLAARAEEVAAMLLPGGKRIGSEYCVGDLSGGQGKSLKVHLNGAKAGVWADFASGEAGDLLDLWKTAKGITFVDALKQAKTWLGVKDEDRTQFRAPSPKKYVRPTLDQHEPLVSGGPVFDYLTKTRRLDRATLEKYRVQQMMHSKFGPSIVFSVFDENGMAVDLVKYLAVRREGDKKTIWATADSRPHLFGWQAIDKNTREVVITEGEIDALTVAGWGFPALSLPSGVKNMEWVEHDYDALTRFDRIYICTDQDKPGDEAAELIAERLGRDRCFRVKIEGFKDANEAECSGKYCGEDFMRAIQCARTLDPQTLRNAAEFVEDLWNEFNPTTEKLGSETPWSIDWRIRPGEVTIWTGWSGHGKSVLLNHVALHDWATTGSKCLIASLEMPVAQSMAQLARMALGRSPRLKPEFKDVADYLGGGFWFYDVVGVKPWREFLPDFAYAVRRYGIRRIVIDSLLRCGVAEDDYESQKEFVEALVVFAATHAVHIHLVAHSRKKDDESKPPGKLDIRGAAAITDLVHNGWSVWRNKEREQKLTEAKAKSANGTVDAAILQSYGARITCWKNRKTGFEESRGLWLVPDAMQFVDNRDTGQRVYFVRL